MRRKLFVRGSLMGENVMAKSIENVVKSLKGTRRGKAMMWGVSALVSVAGLLPGSAASIVGLTGGESEET